MAVTYAQYIQTFLTIDEDNNGLFVNVPGYADDSFKVRVDESGLVPHSTHCRCQEFKHEGTCFHAKTVNAFYARLYRSNVVKADAKAINEAMDCADAQEKAYELVAIDEQISSTESVRHFTVISAPQIVAPPKVIKLDYQSKRTASFFESLPSHQKPAA